MSWWPWLGGLWTLIIGGGFIALIVWGISRLSHQSATPAKSSALDIVKEHYAKGDISK
jgi:uncharacterized membrane protein